MLRLGQSREEIGVVADQFGNPTSALDIADAVLAIARRMVADSSPSLRGLFHMAGGGRRPGPISPKRFSRKARSMAARRCGKQDRHRRIIPSPAPRPANSRLDCGKLQRIYSVALPPWRRVAGAVRRTAAGRPDRLTKLSRRDRLVRFDAIERARRLHVDSARNPRLSSTVAAKAATTAKTPTMAKPPADARSTSPAETPMVLPATPVTASSRHESSRRRRRPRRRWCRKRASGSAWPPPGWKGTPARR